MPPAPPAVQLKAHRAPGSALSEGRYLPGGGERWGRFGEVQGASLPWEQASTAAHSLTQLKKRRGIITSIQDLTSRMPTSAPVQFLNRGDSALGLHDGGPAPANPLTLDKLGAAAPLPYLDQLQPAFGRHDLSGIQAHTAPDACDALGAEAFASGNRVVFRGTPDLHTAAHEAAHVVQQRGGVQLKDGLGRAGDEYEVHADQVADRVVQGQSAESLLDQRAGSSGPLASASSPLAPLQRSGGGGEPEWAQPTRDKLGKDFTANRHAAVLVYRQAWVPTGEQIPVGTQVHVINVDAAAGAVQVSWKQGQSERRDWTYHYALEALRPVPATPPVVVPGATQSPTAAPGGVSRGTPSPMNLQGNPPAGGQQAAQGPEGGGVDIKVGSATRVAVEVSIPLWGPVKLIGKLEGSATSAAGVTGLGSATPGVSAESEVEVSIFAGLELDFFFFRLFAGVEGRAKLMWDGLGGAAGMMRALEEVFRWVAAKQLKDEVGPRVAKAVMAVRTGQTRVDGQLQSLKARAGTADFQNQLSRRNVLEIFQEQRVVERIDDELWGTECAIREAFRGYDIKEDQLTHALGRQETMTELAAMGQAPSTAAAVDQVNRAQNVVAQRHTETIRQVESTYSSLQPQNRPDLGFEASIGIKAGAAVDFGPKGGNSLEVTAAWLSRVGDEKHQRDERTAREKPQQEWDTEAKSVFTLEASGTFGLITLGASLESVEDTLKLGFKGYWEKELFVGGWMKDDKDTATTVLKELGERAKAITRSMGRAGKDPSVFQGIVAAIGQMYLDQTAQSAVGRRRVSKGGLELGLEFKSGALKKIEIKAVWTPEALDASRALGLRSGDMVQGSVESGGFLTVTINL